MTPLSFWPGLIGLLTLFFLGVAGGIYYAEAARRVEVMIADYHRQLDDAHRREQWEGYRL